VHLSWRRPFTMNAQAPLSKLSLFVGGLPETVGTDELTAKFAKFGELSDAFGAPARSVLRVLFVE
jgi:hypothetical protein